MRPELFSLPFEEFRSDGVDQKQAIIQLIETKTRFVSLIAPPGSGKTIISLAYGEVQGRTLFLTPTKHLHTSLEEYGVFSLHGHSHYSCWQNGECVESDCEHGRRMKIARTKNRVGTTYANWIGLNRRGQNSIGRFDLIVCDEAHNLPWIIASQMTFTLGEEWCNDLELTGDGLASTQGFLRSVLPKVSTDKRYDKERMSIETFLRDTTENSSWLCTRDKKELSCRVVWPKRYSRHIFGDSKVLLMSATLSYQTLRYLNIDLADNTFIELETNFDPKMCPFIAVPVVAVQYNMLQQDCDKLIQFIDQVIQTRPTQGIIHSVSYEYARMILERSGYSSMMISHRTSGTIMEAIELFLKRRYKVLVSPSLSEGVSLEGDSCRWQIPIKIPTLNKQDALTAMRCAQDKAYEPFLMANQIQQQHGRGRRSITDWCESLMPDVYWSRFYKRNRQFFMKWFRDTIKDEKMLPSPLRARRK